MSAEHDGTGVVAIKELYMFIPPPPPKPGDFFDNNFPEEEQHEYSVVREEVETITEKYGTQKIVKGYDSKGRLVEIAIVTTHNDGSKSHVAKYVTANGCWVGGFGMYDNEGNYLHGGSMKPEPFK